MIFLHDEKIFFGIFFSKLELYISTFDSSAIYRDRENVDTLAGILLKK